MTLWNFVTEKRNSSTRPSFPQELQHELKQLIYVSHTHYVQPAAPVASQCPKLFWDYVNSLCYYRSPIFIFFFLFCISGGSYGWCRGALLLPISLPLKCAVECSPWMMQCTFWCSPWRTEPVYFASLGAAPKPPYRST